MKLRPVSIVLFLLAVAAYIIAPPLAVGLFAVGFLFELAGWVSVFRDHQRDKNRDKKSE